VARHRGQELSVRRLVLDVLVFSKDRACQLDLLLRSIKRSLTEWRDCRINVLYTFSARRFERGYAATMSRHPEFAWTCELDEKERFRELVLSVVGRNDHVAFLVDDDVLKAPVSLGETEFKRFLADDSIACLSLRLCPQIDHSYALERTIAVPRFEDGTIWNWTQADGEWGYPMSLDGHVFRSGELVPLLQRLDFANPNTLESALSTQPLPQPRAICFPTAKLVNLPLNRIQQTFPNRNMGMDREWLNQQFLDGRRLSLSMVWGLGNRAVHHDDVQLVWDD
jgi:hypothetical protein